LFRWFADLPIERKLRVVITVPAMAAFAIAIVMHVATNLLHLRVAPSPSSRYSGWGYYGAPVPTYWVWVPGSAVFDYPFADWRGPTGGWGNP